VCFPPPPDDSTSCSLRRRDCVNPIEPVPVPNDQRGDGIARVVGTDADIGAFERQGKGNCFVFAGDFENARCP